MSSMYHPTRSPTSVMSTPSSRRRLSPSSNRVSQSDTRSAAARWYRWPLKNSLMDCPLRAVV